MNALIISSIYRIIFYSNVNLKAETMNKYRCRESIITINMKSTSRSSTLSQKLTAVLKENDDSSLNSGLYCRLDLYSPSVSYRSFWATRSILPTDRLDDSVGSKVNIFCLGWLKTDWLASSMVDASQQVSICLMNLWVQLSYQNWCWC